MCAADGECACCVEIVVSGGAVYSCTDYGWGKKASLSGSLHSKTTADQNILESPFNICARETRLHFHLRKITQLNNGIRAAVPSNLVQSS